MKILVLGAAGMIGHKMVQVLSETFPETYAGLRKPFATYEKFGVFKAGRCIHFADLGNWSETERTLANCRPEVILNAAGITLRKEEIKELSYCVEINGLLPHRLKCWAAQNDAKVIQFSTDCVFDGSGGPYTENSIPSAKDNYGRTKYLGEIGGDHGLTLRGSMIGREIFGKTELLEWALSKKGQRVSGFSRALYSGVTTTVMANLVVRILRDHPQLRGLYQVSSSAISKFDLLEKINRGFQLDMEIQKDDHYATNKELICEKLNRDVGFVCPSWDEMIAQLANEKTSY